MLEEKLDDAIFDENNRLVKKLLEQGANPNIIIDHSPMLNNALYDLEDDDVDAFDTVINLLKYGANPNIYESTEDASPIHVGATLVNVKVIRTLFDYGANPNLKGGYENGFPLLIVCARAYDGVIPELYIEAAKLLLKYGASSTINEWSRSAWVSTPLLVAIETIDDDLVNLILDNGADLSTLDESGHKAIDILKTNKEKYTKKVYEKLKAILNPINPPYLKLGDNETDKYIIYENDVNNRPYVFADKQNHKDKKYLYADNKIDLFFYWSYKNNLLVESVMKVVKNYIDAVGVMDYENISELVINISGDTVTSDLFIKEGKEFATSYLTVTNWSYSLHSDFNKLFNEKDNLPGVIENQESFDTTIKLLDIRYQQFQSGKEFNSNQNKEELEALLEGKEPTPRYVKLQAK